MVAKPPRLIVIEMDPTTSSVRFVRVRKMRDRAGEKMTWTPDGLSLVKNVWLRERAFPMNIFAQKRYVVMKKGDPRPIGFASDFRPLKEYDTATFDAAVSSEMGLRFMRGGKMDWKVVVMLMLGVIVLALIGLVAYLSSAPVKVTP